LLSPFFFNSLCPQKKIVVSVETLKPVKTVPASQLALQAECGAMSLQERERESAMQEARARVLRERAQKEKKATAPQGQGRRAKFRADADWMARVDAFGEAQFNEKFKSQLGDKLFLNPTYDFILPPF
jgi:hypothetical protein